MPRNLILGTAGHIDHGKTTLIQALTGIDCDRLPEEKQRGITIDIGFAHLDLELIHLGIVDVPGHERFIRNMLAGAAGIDMALLVVAADDSVMPQTREHLDILRQLRLRHGVIAITKCDLVDATTRDVVLLEVRELVQGTFLESAPVVFASAMTGEGISELKTALQCVAETIEPRSKTDWFRIAIDRAFILQGHGCIVTGSISSGVVNVGDELEWHRGDGTVQSVRVRFLSHHGRSVQSLERGQRAAINLTGVTHDEVHRGQELATPGYLQSSRVLTVQMNALHPRGIRHRLEARFYLGTAETMATVSLLDADQLPQGTSGLAQVFLDSPVTAVWGQPFVLRDSSAEHTIGGGYVLQPIATKLRRRHIESLERIQSLISGDEGVRADIAGWFAGYRGITIEQLVSQAGLNPDSAVQRIQTAVQAGQFVELVVPPNRSLTLHSQRIKELGEHILDTLKTLHDQNPLMTNHDRQKVVAQLAYVGDDALLQVMIDRLIRARQLVGDQRRIARSDFKPKLSINQRKLKEMIVQELSKAKFSPPDPQSFANRAGGNASSLKEIFEVAVAEGYLVKLNEEIFLSADAEREMRSLVRERLQQRSSATVAEIRDLLGTTRKYAVPFCEYLDRVGVTLRQGDVRVLGSANETTRP